MIEHFIFNHIGKRLDFFFTVIPPPRSVGRQRSTWLGDRERRPLPRPHSLGPQTWWAPITFPIPLARWTVAAMTSANVRHQGRDRPPIPHQHARAGWRRDAGAEVVEYRASSAGTGTGAGATSVWRTASAAPMRSAGQNQETRGINKSKEHGITDFLNQ